ncbi:response regulator [Caballeronia grimmiae]
MLVVDDFMDIADSIAMILQIDHYATEVAYRGRDAVAIAKRWQPDIVLLDIWMPGMSGLEVARLLRAQPETADMVIVGHSALSGAADFEAAKAAGFDAYCSKPTDPACLAPLLQSLCK